MTPARVAAIVLAMLCLAPAGCNQWFINDADREVENLVYSRELAALGETPNADIGPEDGEIHAARDMYDFAPSPADPAIPEEFRERPSQMLPMVEELAGPRQVYALSEAITYALRHAREFQTEKEQLYLSALALSLERFLWTPQPFANLSYEFADYGQIRDFDRAMTAVAEAGASQRLPLGGEVTARVLATWMRDLGEHVTTAETGQMILEADIPLLRGAGRVALESRYQAERNLIYAVRVFERFRRAFVVDIAREYFSLLAVRAEIENARLSEQALYEEFKRSAALAATQRALQVDADRAEFEYLQAQNAVVNATATYQTALDRFKIVLGMPAATQIDILDSAWDLVSPDVAEGQAIDTALRYRLDLLNDHDAVDDARRAVRIAENNLLPDFDFRGSVAMETKPNKKNVLAYNTERTTWRGAMALEIPVNRKVERNDYRTSLIDLRRSERNYDLRRDEVRVDVRDALRQLEQARLSMQIQAKNIVINQFRADQARELLRKSRLESNRDVVEAEQGLLSARNRYAQAESDYRAAVLQFLLNTGTLRLDDGGRLLTFHEAATVQARGAS